MKKVISPLILLILVLYSFTSTAQNPCDTCTAPWGPIMRETLTNQKIPPKPDTCRYTFMYEYRMRDCNGSIEIDLISLITRAENANGFCKLNNFGDCYYSRQAGIRSLVDLLGIPVTFSQEKACYAKYIIDPPQDFLDCFLSPGETVDEWYAYIECDGSSCCRTTYFPNGDGTVTYQYDTSLACTPGALPTLPAFLIWECKGQTFVIPVDQDQALDCEDTCPDGSGVLYRKKDNLEEKELIENNFALYPNPSKGNVTLEYNVKGIDQLEVVVFNIQGQIVMNQIIKPTEGSAKIQLETTQWNAGIYTVQIKGNNQFIESQKIQLLK